MTNLFQLIANACAIMGISVLGIITYINSEEEKSEFMFEATENEEATEKYSTDKIVEDAAKNLSVDIVANPSNTNFSPNADIQDEKNIELINVEDEVKRIRNDYNNVQKQKSNPQQHPVDKNIKIYYVEDNVVSIEITSGYNDIDYSRIYYFDKDGKLYFAFVFDRKRENRLYFKNNILIRYIDENGEIYNLYENLENCMWCELVLYESYELLESVN